MPPLSPTRCGLCSFSLPVFAPQEGSKCAMTQAERQLLSYKDACEAAHDTLLKIVPWATSRNLQHYFGPLLLVLQSLHLL